MPTTSLNVTKSPSWNSRRSSSTHVTRAGQPAETDATMPECGSSPSGSWTVNAGPKSQKTLAKTPRASARMNAIGGDAARQISSIRFDSSSDALVSTTTFFCVVGLFGGMER